MKYLQNFWESPHKLLHWWQKEAQCLGSMETLHIPTPHNLHQQWRGKRRSQHCMACTGATPSLVPSYRRPRLPWENMQTPNKNTLFKQVAYAFQRLWDCSRLKDTKERTGCGGMGLWPQYSRSRGRIIPSARPAWTTLGDSISKKRKKTEKVGKKKEWLCVTHNPDLDILSTIASISAVSGKHEVLCTD